MYSLYTPAGFLLFAAGVFYILKYSLHLSLLYYQCTCGVYMFLPDRDEVMAFIGERMMIDNIMYQAYLYEEFIRFGVGYTTEDWKTAWYIFEKRL